MKQILNLKGPIWVILIGISYIVVLAKALLAIYTVQFVVRPNTANLLLQLDGAQVNFGHMLAFFGIQAIFFAFLLYLVLRKKRIAVKSIIRFEILLFILTIVYQIGESPTDGKAQAIFSAVILSLIRPAITIFLVKRNREYFVH